MTSGTGSTLGDFSDAVADVAGAELVGVDVIARLVLDPVHPDATTAMIPATSNQRFDPEPLVSVLSLISSPLVIAIAFSRRKPLTVDRAGDDEAGIGAVDVDAPQRGPAAVRGGRPREEDTVAVR
jgi:hypothetical protein